MKTLGKLLLVGGVAWLVGCLGMFLWWHFKVLNAVNVLESRTLPPQPGQSRAYSVPEDAENAILDGGCRSLKYLVNSLKDSKNIAYNVIAYELLAKITQVPAGQTPPERAPVPATAKMTYNDQNAERDAHILEIQKWWLDHQKEWHQGWRVWSKQCPVPQKP